MQIVYISNRAHIARETLVYVENLMPFITEAVFVCPGSQVKDFHFKSRIPVRVIDERSVLGKDFRRFREAGDHQFKNCLLRFSLARVKDIGDEFIMSDDDNRPLVEIPFSFYKSSNKYFGYYYYDLKKWSARETDYDRGQHETCGILEGKGYDTLSYSSHMPQMIHKGLLAEAAGVFQESLDQGAPLDEWSAYFNFGQSVYPERFHPPKPFKTLCWPLFPSDWDYDVRPEDFCFENFYPMLHENSLMFSDLPTRFDGALYAEIANEKIWRRTVLQKDFEAGKTSLWGKMFFLCRDMAGRFPHLKRRLNAMLPASRQAAVLNFFMSGSSRRKSDKDPNRRQPSTVNGFPTPSKMKILVNAFPMVNVNTGIGRYLRCLYQALEEHYGDELEIGYFDGKKVSSAMPSGPENLTRWSRLVSIFWRLPAYPAFFLRLCFHFNQERNFRRYVKDYDVYHEAGFFPFLTPSNVKIVFTLHDLSVFRFPQYHPRERVLYSRTFIPRRCKNVSQFITVSDFSRSEMKQFLNIPNEKIHVIYEGFSVPVFSPRPVKEVRGFLSARHLPEKYFLFVGSGDPRKNMEIIPEVLDQAGLEVPLVVAGWSGWAGKNMWGKVLFLGYVEDDDLARLYSGAVALIFPSRYEGFGLPILEAMACGCPVVTTREASMPEVAGDAALYMKDPDDAEGLAKILKELVENPLHRRGWVEKGLVQAGRFSWRNTAEATFGAFEQTFRERNI